MNNVIRVFAFRDKSNFEFLQEAEVGRVEISCRSMFSSFCAFPREAQGACTDKCSLAMMISGGEFFYFLIAKRTKMRAIREQEKTRKHGFAVRCEHNTNRHCEPKATQSAMNVSVEKNWQQP